MGDRGLRHGVIVQRERVSIAQCGEAEGAFVKLILVEWTLEWNNLLQGRV
jgi:hypothetical protein